MNNIKILCPGRKCGKCRRMIQRVDEAVRILDIEAEIETIDGIDEMLNYRTWILPTLVINEKGGCKRLYASSGEST